MSDLDFNANFCRGRQQRLLAEMQKLNLDLVIVQLTEHVQYLTGARYPWTMSPAAALRADGRLTLAAPKKPVLENAADEVVTYEAQWHSTLRNDQRQASSVELLKALGNLAGVKRIGVEFSCFTSHLGRDSGRAGRYRTSLISPPPPQRPGRTGQAAEGDRRHREDVCPGPADRRARNHGDRRFQSLASGGGRRISAKC